MTVFAMESPALWTTDVVTDDSFDFTAFPVALSVPLACAVFVTPCRAISESVSEYVAVPVAVAPGARMPSPVG